MKHHPNFRQACSASVLLCLSVLFVPLSAAQNEPTFTISDPVALFEELIAKEAGIAINTSQPEMLVITIDTAPVDAVDPITGELAMQALYGAFYNPVTLEKISDPFVIVGNPYGEMETNDVKFNPVTNQYVVVTKANGFGTAGRDVPLLALVNSTSVGGDPIAKAFAYELESDQDFDDVAVAASTRTGNFLLVAERDFEGESGEGVAGALFDKEGNLLTPQFAKLDTLEPTRDEDDPDVIYLEENDVFLFITNIDPSTSPNRITATVIQAEPDVDGRLQVGQQQIVSKLRKNYNAGHADAIENPYNKEFIGVLDYDNGAAGGDIFYFNIGPAPDYIFTETRPQIPYLEAESSWPYSHRHPQLALDPSSGVFVISHNATGEFQGMVFTLLGPDGGILPGRPDDLPYHLVETADPISNSANYHNVVYDPHSDSFIVVYSTGGGWTEAVRLTVTSNHLPESVDDWVTR